MPRLGLVLAAALIAPPATAGEPTEAPATKKERIICKSEITTSTRTRSERRCMTAAQWREKDRPAKGDEVSNHLIPEFNPTQTAAGPN
jgi:hypothetical protein